MTLVVARASRGRIAIVSDTMLTEHDRALGLQHGVIKSCMLPGGICVSFANSPELAARDIQSFAESHSRGADFEDVIAFFEKSSSQTGNDYILAFARSPRLMKIADGKRMPSAAATVWIGAPQAYERFREYESKQRRKTESGRAVNAVLFADEIDGSPASDLYSTMRHVVADDAVSTAGGFACAISSRGEHFRYSVYSDMLFDWPEMEGDDFILHLEDQIDMGATAENEGYSVAQISTGFLDLNAVGFYLLKGKKLFVFYGTGNGLADKCVVLRDVPPSDIVLRLALAFGVDLKWLMLVTSSPLANGRTTYRLARRVEEPKGVGIPFFCHANTFTPP